MRRLEIVVEKAVRRAFDRAGKAVRLLQEVTDPDGVLDRLLRGKRAVAQLYLERWTIDELHRDVKVLSVGAVVVHLRHHSVPLSESLLQDGAVTLRGDALDAPFLVPQHQLQRHRGAVGSSRGAEHRPGVAAADGLVVGDLEVAARHHRLRSGMRAGTETGMTMTLPSSSSRRLASANPLMISTP